MIKIWGRINSVNVQKVLWCCDELNFPYERVDAGLHFGRNTDPDFLAMNPNGRVPLLEDGDFVLWESNSILRYLLMKYAPQSAVYPQAPQERASIDRWLDWTLSTLSPAERSVFLGMIRTPEAERDMKAIQKAADGAGQVWSIVDAHLKGRTFIEGDNFTLADIVLGVYCRRFLGLDGIRRPPTPELQRWYDTLHARPAFQRHVAPALT
jgi:glutathione S-transferase